MGEEGEDTLGKSFTESFRSGGGWTVRSPPAATPEIERVSIGRNEGEERKKKGDDRTGIEIRVPTSMAPYCVTLSMWCDPRSSWIPMTPSYLKLFNGPRVSGWLKTCAWIHIWKLFSRTLFVNMFSKRVKLKKLHPNLS
jgi:hypothetical protein